MTTESTNYLSPSVINQATSLLNQGDVSGAWQVLADDDLVMNVIGSEDQITIQGWYLSTANQIEIIQSGDDMALANSDLEQLVTAMSAFTAPAAGELTLPADLQEELAPVLATVWQAT